MQPIRCGCDYIDMEIFLLERTCKEGVSWKLWAVNSFWSASSFKPRSCSLWDGPTQWPRVQGLSHLSPHGTPVMSNFCFLTPCWLIESLSSLPYVLTASVFNPAFSIFTFQVLILTIFFTSNFISETISQRSSVT